MKQINQIERIQEKIQENTVVLLYFTGNSCGACEVIRQKVASILEDYPEVEGIQVNGENSPEIAANYQVYTLPTMLLFVEGKESIRIGKNIDLLDFEKRLVRYRDLLSL